MVEEEANCYKFKIGLKYAEPYSSYIFPVEVCYDKSHNIYHLGSSKVDIHNLESVPLFIHELGKLATPDFCIMGALLLVGLVDRFVFC